MMASSGKETLDIKTVHQCNRCLGCKTLHPQASIIRLDHTNVEQHSIKFDFYTILLMENDIEDCCCCGRKAYDYSNATMVFLPPEQTFDMHKNRVLPQQGWLLAFHPDLLYGTTLEKNIQEYTFFFYRKEEALHLSQREKDKIIECLREMDEELHHPIDRHSQTLISRYIELLLDYCTRFYERQFITRENKNKVLLDKTDRLLDDYIYSGKLKWEGLPTSAYCAENLKLSVAYFEDLLTFETGKTLPEFFQLKRMETAKRMLLDKENTIKAIAGQLGFSNTQLFCLFFKKITGVTPNEYRHSQN
ncbi:helix-turn-helix domain-containing protein [Bacteroides fragilis]|uniref:helix-turn-helix domain-containing protein n=1 Tax=Bacteroides fragilis TaxID=817 RepID=UPI00202EFF75|nr:helix-turn-helix transcriptional regulator [Bacteroides fragilis]MCM0314547.1 helix-turn-helix transcriptional regulator [Bacteroides fragilis]